MFGNPGESCKLGVRLKSFWVRRGSLGERGFYKFNNCCGSKSLRGFLAGKNDFSFHRFSSMIAMWDIGLPWESAHILCLPSKKIIHLGSKTI